MSKVPGWSFRASSSSAAVMMKLLSGIASSMLSSERLSSIFLISGGLYMINCW